MNYRKIITKTGDVNLFSMDNFSGKDEVKMALVKVDEIISEIDPEEGIIVRVNANNEEIYQIVEHCLKTAEKMSKDSETMYSKNVNFDSAETIDDVTIINYN